MNAPFTPARLHELLRVASNFSSQSMRTAALGVLRKEAANAIPVLLDQLAAQAAEIERVKFEREALVNAAICGQRSLHSDMINRWGDLRDAVLHGLDGLDNDQTNAVLGCIDDHFPSDIKPAVAEESSDTENRADKAQARVAELEGRLKNVVAEWRGRSADMPTNGYYNASADLSESETLGGCADEIDAVLAKREGIPCQACSGRGTLDADDHGVGCPACGRVGGGR